MAPGGKSQIEKANERRLARFHSNVTDNQIDLSQVHQKPIVKATLGHYEACQRNFSLFLQVMHPELSDFTTLYAYGSPLPGAVLLKEFLVFYSRSSKGSLDPSGKVTVWTVLTVFRTLLGLLAHSTGHTASQSLTKDVCTFVMRDLQKQED